MDSDIAEKSPSTVPPGHQNVDYLQFKENFNFEGKTRIDDTRDELVMEYDGYLEKHPEITDVLNDIVLHVLILKPDNPLQEIRSYMQARLNVL
ncbi:unnamed protein product [Phytomonas sp. Hart1]|nr:unnamed protein product [Phytomonas sp. Hart1]|eukprot:CCW69644.1 unnamed protein product [Phytomonas sp. isolate Hart1]